MPSKKLLYLTLIILLSGHFSKICAATTVGDSLIQLLSETEESEQATIYNELSYVVRYTDAPLSISYGKKALTLAEKYNQPNEKYLAYCNLAVSYLNHDTLNLSLQYHQKALELAQQVGDSLQIARSRFELGTYYTEKGYYENALTHLLSSLEILEKLSQDKNTTGFESKISFITNNIGTLYSRINNNDKAMEYYRYSLGIKENLGDSLGVAHMLNNIGLLFVKENNLEKAEEYYKEALRIIKKDGDEIDVSESISVLMLLMMKQKQYSKAIGYFDTLETYFNVMPERAILAALSNISSLWLDLGKPDKAYAYISQMIELSKRSNTIWLLSESYKLIAEYYAQKNNFEEAYLYHKKYLQLKDSVMNLEMNSKMAEMQTKYETEKKEKQIAILQKDKQLTQVAADRQRAMKLLYLISSLIILLIAVLIILKIKNRDKRKQEILEKQNLENEQRLLRTQMNPHFLFNSLNTVQGFISANDGFKAMTFLSKFGNLLRDILENSRESMISLENELNTLHLYIEMEQLRYSNSFEFEIIVDKKLDTEQSMIPPLIIQPFVENSIKHGLSSKKGNGKLTIELVYSKGFIKIKIADNGIGREKSKELTRSKPKQHKSLGLKLTTERLKKIEKTTGVKTSVKIIDLYDKEGIAEGTLVVIDIPNTTKT